VVLLSFFTAFRAFFYAAVGQQCVFVVLVARLPAECAFASVPVVRLLLFATDRAFFHAAVGQQREFVAFIA
jgi:hypothetical protein